jgi:hypothetical protein
VINIAANPMETHPSAPRIPDIPIVSRPFTQSPCNETARRQLCSLSPYKVTPRGVTTLPRLPDRYVREVSGDPEPPNRP